MQYKCITFPAILKKNLCDVQNKHICAQERDRTGNFMPMDKKCQPFAFGWDYMAFYGKQMSFTERTSRLFQKHNRFTK